MPTFAEQCFGIEFLRARRVHLDRVAVPMEYTTGRQPPAPEVLASGHELHNMARYEYTRDNKVLYFHERHSCLTTAEMGKWGEGPRIHIVTHKFPSGVECTFFVYASWSIRDC